MLCRSAGLRPQAGAVFEDTAARQDTASQAAGPAAGAEAARQPEATAAVKSEPAQAVCLPNTPSIAPISSQTTFPASCSVPTLAPASNLDSTQTLPHPKATLGVTGSSHYRELVVLDGAGDGSSGEPNQAVRRPSSLPAAGTKRSHSAATGLGSGTIDG